MKNLLLTTVMILISLASFGQERNILWAHGLNSNGDFWNDEYSRSQRDFRVRSTGFSFPTNEGVINYANRIRNSSIGIQGNQSIGIGHSLGGVALREIDKQNPNSFGGFITFGAPLDGARIANGVIQGTPINQFVTQSVDNLRRGPIASSTRNVWQKFRDTVNDVFKGGKGITSILIRSIASRPVLDVTNDLTEGFEQTILDIYDPNDQTIQDLAENSNYFNSISNL
ncbi:alpha/beta hydrolase [Belliella baltica]|nr:alpha/beta hydrolase [Belliella baltica]